MPYPEPQITFSMTRHGLLPVTTPTKNNNTNNPSFTTSPLHVSGVQASHQGKLPPFISFYLDNV